MSEIVHANNLGNEQTEFLAEQIRRYIQTAEAHAEKASNALHQALHDAWNAGAILNAARPRFAHGEWLPWLDEQNISRSTARRYMKLADQYEYRQLAKVDSINSAIRGLPKPVKEPVPPPDDDPLPPAKQVQPEPAQPRVDPVAAEALRQQTRMAEERAAEAERQVAEQAQLIAHYEESEKVADGFQQGRSVIEEGQDEIRRLKARIAELETKNTELVWEIRKKDRIIRRLRGQIPKGPRAPTPPVYGTEDIPDEDEPPPEEEE